MFRLPFYFRKLLLVQIFLATSILMYFIILKGYLNFDDNSFKPKYHRQTHLLDNSCKFAWTEPLDSTLKKYLKFPKELICKTNNTLLFNRNSATGEFTLRTSTYSDELECIVYELVGGLKPDASHFEFGKTETFIPTIGKVFWINRNNFYIRCFKSTFQVYQNAFMGLKLEESEKLYIEGKTPTYKSINSKESETKYSVSILVFDSVSRAQFSRHMTKTLKLMKDLGTVVFEAYNKVGDNSAINMTPILAEELNETSKLDDLDEDGDVNLKKVFPPNFKLNPDKINWIWNRLGKEYRTLFNDDTMHTHRGLFHYPPSTFEGGFTNNPTSFYHRPFYLNLYTHLNNMWRKCLDGEFLTEKFIDTWFRFENVFSSVPHFGLSFLASLTHDNPNNLEYLDDVMFDKINHLNQTKSLESTFLIIMGDHGNRIHPLNRFTFAGKIEERAPFLSILMPSKFRNDKPEKAKMLEDNSHRFISNFDLHETLLEILQLKSNGRRGRSLFKYQEHAKSCQQNNIISNHCLCMVDAKADLIGKPENRPNSQFQPTLDFVEQPVLRRLPKNQLLVGICVVPTLQKLTKVLKNYLSDNHLTECFLLETIECEDTFEVFMPNNYVQVWARTKISQKEINRKKKKSSPVVYVYLNCTIKSSLSNKLLIETQIRIVQDFQFEKIVFPPKISAADNCSYYSFPSDYCECSKLMMN